jgi:hypothetical protein
MKEVFKSVKNYGNYDNATEASMAYQNKLLQIEATNV